MRLKEALGCLAKRRIGIVGTWEIQGKKGITLGDPSKFFPHPSGPRYQIETTDDQNPELTQDEIDALERRFGPLS